MWITNDEATWDGCDHRKGLSQGHSRTRGLAVHTSGSRIASFESREGVEVESGRAVSRESRVGGELKGADEESRAGCWVRLEVAFLVHRAAKSAPFARVSDTAKAPKKVRFFKTLPCRMAVRGTKTGRQIGNSDGPRWPAVLRCSVSRCNRRGIVCGGSGRVCSVRVTPLE